MDVSTLQLFAVERLAPLRQFAQDERHNLHGAQLQGQVEFLACDQPFTLNVGFPRQ